MDATASLSRVRYFAPVRLLAHLQQQKQDKLKIIRKRVEYEDKLLNTRTTIVLTLNGLIAVAVTSSMLRNHARIWAMVFVMLLNLLMLPILPVQGRLTSNSSKLSTVNF